MGGTDILLARRRFWQAETRLGTRPKGDKKPTSAWSVIKTTSELPMV